MASRPDAGGQASPGPCEHPALHDPLETLSVQPLHRSASVSVYEVQCRPRDFGRGGEEWSRTHQVVFPRRGVFEREVRGQKQIADANQVLFFNRDESYHIEHPGGVGDDCTVFDYSEGLLREAIGDCDPAGAESVSLFRFPHAPCEQRVFALHDLLRRSLVAGQSGQLAVDELAARLLGAVIRNAYRAAGVSPRPRREGTSRLHREQVQRTRLLLSTRFSEALSLDAIAEAVHCSPFHLARLFRRESGLSIHQYRHRLRLREALRRLAADGVDLSLLALELGFASHSHFSDAFRDAFGLAPSQCRELQSRRLSELSRNLEVVALQRS